MIFLPLFNAYDVALVSHWSILVFSSNQDEITNNWCDYKVDFEVDLFIGIHGRSVIGRYRGTSYAAYLYQMQLKKQLIISSLVI